MIRWVVIMCLGIMFAFFIKVVEMGFVMFTLMRLFLLKKYKKL